MSTRLATAEWANPALVEEKYLYRSGDIWLGRSAGDRQLPIGYHDDRHVCLVSGSRSGKGTSSIINNLCLWPGSVVVVDPKGENAGITVPRRGKGSAHCEGMGQDVHVLDPFRAAQVDESYRSRFNPLDALNPEDEETIDEAGRIADAIVVTDKSKDPFWDESARAMVRGLILYVLTAEDYEGRRNLITVRQLIMRGDSEGIEVLRDLGETEFPSAHGLLWTRMRQNQAFEGLVAGIADSFANMLSNSPKQYESVLQVANRNTEFIDSPAMQRCLEASDFKLSDLKTKPEGTSLFLSLPQRFMETHYRWLRMMIGLTLSEMEKVRGRPASGHPVLFLLDEFAGLDRMKTIEKGVAQMAGHGVKMFFVLQTLQQLKDLYKDNWETFLSNAGLKIFFGLDDHFSREYVSKLIGETEVIREMRSGSDTVSESESYSHSTGTSISRSRSVSEGTNRSSSDSVSSGVNRSMGDSTGYSRSDSWSPAGFLDLMEKNRQKSQGRNSSTSRSHGTSRGRSHSDTSGVSHGTSDTYGTTTSETDSVTRGTSRARTTGTSETAHRRPLISPDEIGHHFARIEDVENGSYPGLALVLISGRYAIALRRVNYFDDYEFAGRFEPHADYPPPLPYKDLCIRAEDAAPYVQFFTFDNVPQMRINDWPVKVGEIVSAGDTVMRFRFGKVILPVASPHTGIITSLPKPDTDAGVSEICSLRYYETDEPETDPFGQIAAYCKSFTIAIRNGLGKATMSAWLMAGLGVLFLGLAIAARNFIFLLPAAFVGYRAFRAAAKVSAHKRILERYPDGVPVNEASRSSHDQKTLQTDEAIGAQGVQPRSEAVANGLSANSSSSAQPAELVSEAPAARPEAIGHAAGDQFDKRPTSTRTFLLLPRLALVAVASLSVLAVTVGLVKYFSNGSEYSLKGHSGEVSAVAFSSDGALLASASEDETVKLWNVATKKELHTLAGRRGRVGSVAFSPDGRLLAAGNEGTITIWDVATGTQVRTIVESAGVASDAVAFGPDGRLLASMGFHDEVQLWDVDSGRQLWARKSIAPITSFVGDKPCIAFSLNGRQVAFGSHDNTIKFLDVASGNEVRTLSGHKSSVTAVSYSPDGKLLASGSYDGSIKLWDVATGRTLHTLSGHTVAVSSVAFSPNGRLLASGTDLLGSDHTIKLWDVADGTETRTVARQNGNVSATVAFSPDGRYLASASSDHTIKLWVASDW